MNILGSDRWSIGKKMRICLTFIWNHVLDKKNGKRTFHGSSLLFGMTQNRFYKKGHVIINHKDTFWENIDPPPECEPLSIQNSQFE